MADIILSDFFSTKIQANDFSERLSTIEDNIYEVDFDLEDQLEKQFGSKRKDKFMSILRENNVSITSNSDLTKFFENIRETIKSLPLLELTIAIEPNSKILKTISDWFILNIKKQVLLEISVNPDIVAGAIVEFNGKRLDASTKPDFDKICAGTLANETK